MSTKRSILQHNRHEDSWESNYGGAYVRLGRFSLWEGHRGGLALSTLLIPPYLVSVFIYLDMDTRPNAMFFAGFILFNGFLISCNGAELSRTKRTVELIEGAKDFILR